MNRKSLLIALLLLAVSCKTKVSNNTVVYTNDFESNNLSQITNAIVTQFNGSAVLGPYNSNVNKGSFSLAVNSLPKHNLITITFDLYIHDSWDGNKPSPDGPDIWQMTVDGNSYIYTTFANIQCNPGYFCSPQAYPDNYPNFNHNPKAGAYATNLPGRCNSGISGGTTQYKIVKTFNHSGSSLLLQCSDKLIQPDAADQLCDESWSIDNLKIQAISL
jgi:hypothetical protein